MLGQLIIERVLDRAGYRLVPKEDAATRLGIALSALKQAGFQPKLIFDVGAHRGTWTRAALEYFPEASYILFEPQSQLKANAEDLLARGGKIEWINCGVGSEPGVQTFALCDRDDSSTFAPPPSAKAQYSRSIEIQVTTLNEFTARRGGIVPELVKIDAEGWDLRVLAGASNLIGRTDVFLMEAAVGNRTMENTAAAVIRRFDELGYRLIDITDINRSPKFGILWLTELVFLRKDCALLDHATTYE